MKVLETLGQHRGQKGVFQYRRSSSGVEIDTTIGTATLDRPTVTLTTIEWTSILEAIEKAAQGSFRLTGTPPFPGPPNQSLYDLIPRAVPNPIGGWTWSEPWLAYVSAILEHEGSMELYAGRLGPESSAYIPLRKDIP